MQSTLEELEEVLVEKFKEADSATREKLLCGVQKAIDKIKSEKGQK